MTEETKNNRSRFERQRRNLILISVLLIVYLSLDLQISTVSVLGNSFIIGSAGNVEIWLWALYAYFLVRYFQFYMIIENREFLSVYNNSMHKYVRETALRLFEMQDLPIRKNENPESYQFSYQLRNADVFTARPWHWELKLNGVITWKMEGGNGDQSFSDCPITVSSRHLLWPKIKSLLKLYLQTPHISEYLLPYCLAAAAILWKAFG